MKLYISLSIAAFILTLDLASKYWVESALEFGQIIPLTSFFNLVLTYNPGAAFSFLSDQSGWQRWFLSGIAGTAVLLIIFFLNRYKHEQLFCFSLSLVLGGASGNLYDRITLGHVVDFLDFYIGSYHWPAFNIADSAIFVGAALMIYDSFRNKKDQETPAEKPE